MRLGRIGAIMMVVGAPLACLSLIALGLDLMIDWYSVGIMKYIGMMALGIGNYIFGAAMVYWDSL